MSQKDEQYTKTTQTYAKLGEKYLSDIKDSTPSELYDFIGLFQKGDSVLDVGTAGSRDAKIMSDAGLVVTGIDVVDEFLESARKNNPTATFIHMDLLDLDFPNEEFDGVWANAVLLHLKRDDVPHALSNLYRVLKVGGKLHVRLKEGSGEKVVKEALSQGEERFFTFFSRSEVEHSLEDAGFKIIRSMELPDNVGEGRKEVTWISVWGEK